MSEAAIYPLAKAAFVLGENVGEVRRKVEREEVEYQLISFGGRKVRAVNHKTLVFLCWVREHDEDLKPALRKKLYESLTQQERLPTHITSGVFRASISEAAKRVRARLDTLRELESQVERNISGDAVLRGTDVEVHRIAALLSGGMSVDEVREDYPSLTADQIAFATTYAAAHPKAGRPYPKLTAKAALRQTDFSALDLDD